MSLSTSTSGVTADGTVLVYVPPNVTAIPRGYNVVNGTYNQVQAGETAALSGVVQIPSGSGQFQATGQVVYRLVTIIAPPA